MGEKKNKYLLNGCLGVFAQFIGQLSDFRKDMAL